MSDGPAAPEHGAPIKVMVVDDSATMRTWLSIVIDKDPRLTVVAHAANAIEARDLIKETNPDILTLDLEMPEMNGIDFLAHLMRLRPMPVIVFSGLVADQSEVATAALKLGAYACIPKPVSPDDNALDLLCDSLATAGAQGLRATISENVILVGASTGGVAAIEHLLAQFPRQSPPIVIAQHMPQRFLESFASRLDRFVSLDVQLARAGAVLKNGSVHLAPGQTRQTCVGWSDKGWHIDMQDRADDDAFCPSVDRLFHSAVPWASRVGALLLTGLGNDGAHGMLALLNGGARTVGQSQNSCVVYGMPGAARALGAVEDEVDIAVAGRTLLQMMELAQ